MNKKQSTPPKKRGATVAAVLCFVAAIAIAGTYTLGNSREARQKEEIARTEENAAKVLQGINDSGKAGPMAQPLIVFHLVENRGFASTSSSMGGLRNFTQQLEELMRP